MSSLPDFIERHIERVLGDWESFARNHCLPASSTMAPCELRNGAAAILGALVKDMRSPQSQQEQRKKSLGKLPGNAPTVTQTAQVHALHRLQSGFSLDQLVAEYRALRASVVRHWATDSDDAANRFDELIRFNEAIDQSLTEAIRWFYQGVERARDVFVGILSHDLRDPLATLQAAAQLQQLSDSSEQRRAADRALKSIRTMEELIGDLADFTRTRLGKPLPVSLQRFDLAAVVRDVVDGFTAVHSDRELQLECAGETFGDWDEGRLKQMLSNLIRNALVHGASDSPIRVNISGGSEAVEISVHNQGVPISEKIQATIFDPLTRGALAGVRRRGQRDGGLGLGLYIVREVAAAHGGTARVSSSAQHGTCFSVSLPRNQ